MGIGKLAGGVALGVGLLQGIKSGIGAIVKSSPHLQASISILKKSLMLVLRPIGDIMSMWVRPFVMSFLQYALGFYKEYKENGIGKALLWAFQNADWGKIITAALGLALTLSIINGGIGLLGSALGLGLASGGGSLILPLSLLLLGFGLGEALGLDALTSIIAGGLGIATSAILVGTGLATGAWAFAIAAGVVVSFMLGSWVGKKLADKFIEWMGGKGQAQGAMTFALGVLTIPVNFVAGTKLMEKGKGMMDIANENDRAGINEKIYQTEKWDIGGSAKTIGEAYVSFGGDVEDTIAKTDELGRSIDGLIPQTKNWLEDTKNTFTTALGLIKNILFGGEDDKKGGIVNFPKDMADESVKAKPTMIEAFSSVFEGNLLGMIATGMTKSQSLYNEIMKLNTTVTTTHIIKTVRE